MALRVARFRLQVLSQLSPTGDKVGGALGETLIDERYASGTGDRQADADLFDVRTVVGLATDTLDLQTVNDSNGVALGAAEVVDFCITASESNTGNLRITPAAATPWNGLLGAAGEHDLKPGASLVLHSTQDGDYPISAGNKALEIENLGAASAVYTIHVIVRRS